MVLVKQLKSPIRGVSYNRKEDERVFIFLICKNMILLDNILK